MIMVVDVGVRGMVGFAYAVFGLLTAICANFYSITD